MAYFRRFRSLICDFCLMLCSFWRASTSQLISQISIADAFRTLIRCIFLFSFSSIKYLLYLNAYLNASSHTFLNTKHLFLISLFSSFLGCKCGKMGCTRMGTLIIRPPAVVMDHLLLHLGSQANYFILALSFRGFGELG